MSRYKDLTGQVFGRLTVIERVENNNKGNTRWLCECNCSYRNKVIVLGYDLKSGHTQSCGCLQKEKQKEITRRYNKYNLSGKYGIGYTSKGEEFYFDLEDYDLIKNCCWRIDVDGYVVTTQNRKTILFHRIVMGVTDRNIQIDHLHGKESRNDNRKHNLRFATNQENSMNTGLFSNNTSGVSGVYFNQRDSLWQAYITVNYKTIHLGCFKDYDDAVKARKEAEEKYFGEWSYDNSMKMVM